MNCTVCGSPAVVHRPDFAHEKIVARHLCATCAAAEGIAIGDPETEARMLDLSMYLETGIHPSWESLAGEHLQSLLTSREECVRRLSSPKSQLRNVSWQILLKK